MRRGLRTEIASMLPSHGQTRPTSSQLGEHRAESNFGQVWPTSGEFGSKPPRNGRTSAQIFKFRPILVHFLSLFGKIYRLRPSVDQTWPGIEKNGAISTEFDPIFASGRPAAKSPLDRPCSWLLEQVFGDVWPS